MTMVHIILIIVNKRIARNIRNMIYNKINTALAEKLVRYVHLSTMFWKVYCISDGFCTSLFFCESVRHSSMII